MKPTSADGENESARTPWPSVPKIDHDEFQQSLAVAQLAVKLCELKKAEIQKQWELEDRLYSHDINTAVTEHEKKPVNERRQKQMELRMRTLAPEGFLDEAWRLIQSAGEHVLREQTDAEYLQEHGGSIEAAENVVDRIRQASRIPFKKLCDPERNKGDSEEIRMKTFSSEGKEETIVVHWMVYTTPKAFYNLFWAYWRANSILTNNERWKEYGEELLALWKCDGVRPNDFLAMERFRRARDKRALNLKKKQQTKLRLPAGKHRKR